MTPSFRKHWEEYVRLVMPPEAGVVQTKETEQSFYAGAMAFISEAGFYGADGMGDTDDEAEAWLTALCEEVAKWHMQRIVEREKDIN